MNKEQQIEEITTNEAVLLSEQLREIFDDDEYLTKYRESLDRLNGESLLDDLLSSKKTSLKKNERANKILFVICKTVPTLAIMLFLTFVIIGYNYDLFEPIILLFALMYSFLLLGVVLVIGEITLVILQIRQKRKEKIE